MDKFISSELKLHRDIKKGDKESLLSLFNVTERFEHMELLTDAEEDDNIKVVLEGLGEIDLKLGADMEKGRKKTIMTLFWYSERSKPISMKRDAQNGEKIVINMWKV
jgi:hypothetical protein